MERIGRVGEDGEIWTVRGDYKRNYNACNRTESRCFGGKLDGNQVAIECYSEVNWLVKGMMGTDGGRSGSALCI